VRGDPSCRLRLNQFKIGRPPQHLGTLRLAEGEPLIGRRWPANIFMNAGHDVVILANLWRNGEHGA
jgi:hypothetical protein